MSFEGVFERAGFTISQFDSVRSGTPACATGECMSLWMISNRHCPNMPSVDVRFPRIRTPLSHGMVARAVADACEFKLAVGPERN